MAVLVAPLAGCKQMQAEFKMFPWLCPKNDCRYRTIHEQQT